MITRRVCTISAAVLALAAVAACVPVAGGGVYGDPYLGGVGDSGHVYRTDDGHVFSTLVERDTYLRHRAERRRADRIYGRVPTDRELRQQRRRERELARAEERRHREAADQRERRRLAEIRRHEREQAREEYRRRQALRDREERRLRRDARAREERRLRREARNRDLAREERRLRREARNRDLAREERRLRREARNRDLAREEHPVPQAHPPVKDSWTPVYRDGQLMYMDEEGRLHSP